MAASIWQVRDDLWEVVERMLPAREPSAKSGRPRVDDRICFNAIVFVLFAGIAWRHPPRETGCSPATGHRRLADWQRTGVFERLHRELLRKLKATGRID